MPGVKAEDYLALPWTIQGPVSVVDDHGNTHFEMCVVELSDFFVAAATESEVLYEFGPALLAFIDSYLNAGEKPPSPSGEPILFEIPPRKIDIPDATLDDGADSTSGQRLESLELVTH